MKQPTVYGAIISLVLGMQAGLPGIPGQWPQPSDKVAVRRVDSLGPMAQDDEQSEELVAQSTVLFRVNSSVLSPESEALLDEIASRFLEDPGVVLRVSGFADSTGSQQVNLKVSQARAEAVAHYLVTKGVPREALKTEARGETSAVQDNTTREGRAQNRRVEVATLSFPYLQWPPPQASARADLPMAWFRPTGGSANLGSVARRLSDALTRGGFGDPSWYSVPSGFATVSRMELFDEGGASLPGSDRFSQAPARKIRGVVDYLRALIGTTPGRYRAIVFVVSSEPFSSSRAIDYRQSRVWSATGGNRIPPAVADVPLTSTYAITALIYEYRRSSEDDEAAFVVPSTLDGQTHLRGAKLWQHLKPV